MTHAAYWHLDDLMTEEKVNLWAEPNDVAGVWITSDDQMLIPYVEVKSSYNEDDDADLPQELSDALSIKFRTPEALYDDGEYHYLFAYEAANNISDYWDEPSGLYIEFSFKLEGVNDDELIKLAFLHVDEHPSFLWFLVEISIIVGICAGMYFLYFE